MRSIAAGVFSLLMATAPVDAQAVETQSAANPFQPVCPAGATPRLVQTTALVAIDAATRWGTRTYDAARQRITLFYADAIRQHFTPPPSLGALPPFGEQVVDDSTRQTPDGHTAVAGRLVLIAKRDGRLRTVFWLDSPLAAAFTDSVFAAVRTADVAHDFEGLPRLSDRGDDTLVVELRAVPVASAVQLPLMKVQLSAYALDTPAMVTKAAHVDYPERAGRAGIGTDARVRFVIGSDGRPVRETLQVTQVDYADFIKPMQQLVEWSQYAPATSRRCAVPTVVVQPFTFQARR